MASDKKSPFKSYKQALITAKDTSVFSRWRIFFIKGDNDFLISQTIKELKRLWIGTGWSVERLEGSTVNLEAFYQATTATSMFEPKLVTFINDAQSIPDIHAIFSSIKTVKDLQNPIVFVWRNKELNSKIQKEISRIGPLMLLCEDPAPWEIREFTLDYCKARGFKLTSSALELFLEATGTSLHKISNEIERLSLVFDQTNRALTREEILPHLDYLKEDHIFKIDQLLCNEAFNKAQLLIYDLLDRGESPLGLLAILAMHCRKSLQIRAELKKGNTASEISKALRLPPTVVQLYSAYVQKRKPSIFSKALISCHELDRKFKSQRFDHEIGLNSIIFELAQT